MIVIFLKQQLFKIVILIISLLYLYICERYYKNLLNYCKLKSITTNII